METAIECSVWLYTRPHWCDSNQCYQFASLFLSDGEDSNTVPEKLEFSMDYALCFLEN